MFDVSAELVQARAFRSAYCCAKAEADLTYARQIRLLGQRPRIAPLPILDVNKLAALSGAGMLPAGKAAPSLPTVGMCPAPLRTAVTSAAPLSATARCGGSRGGLTPLAVIPLPAKPADHLPFREAPDGRLHGRTTYQGRDRRRLARG